ncbi:CHAD domain-containing protein [Microbulbifer thermotolerans]|uniref:CHAD domain-containing protein n=1 Tax=Microbulbifer thermotolerans TaxID=252514 RepID=A0A143HQX8_MICTH|nr:CHAD domain-containing protein [Microbulbifer thermotolerans]AMX03820.1 hypothetical protein A3224_15585 [Microbulbifer thermotolerans]
MTYRLNRDIPLADALRCTAREEITASLDALQQRPGEEAVHEVRKHCKKMRALLRLVRAQIPDCYRIENAHYRALANSLSGTRDAVSIRDALLMLAPPERFPNTFAFLQQNAKTQTDPEALAAAAEMLRQGLSRIDNWPLAQLHWRHTKHGYRQGYRRARKALSRARAEAGLEQYHELRKRVKDHWYHCRLLQDTWREATPRSAPLKQMAQALGDWRDLKLLCALLSRHSQSFSGELIPVINTAQERIVKLRGEVKQLGRTLFTEHTPHCKKNSPRRRARENKS